MLFCLRFGIENLTYRLVVEPDIGSVFSIFFLSREPDGDTDDYPQEEGASGDPQERQGYKQPPGLSGVYCILIMYTVYCILYTVYYIYTGEYNVYCILYTIYRGVYSYMYV